MRMNWIKQIWHEPVVVALCNFIVVLCLYSAARVFFYLITKSLYADMTFNHFVELMIGGMRFDITAILYLSSVYLLLALLPFEFRNNDRYQSVAKWLFWIPNMIGIAVNCIDMVYVQFSDRRTTIAFFSEFANDDNLGLVFINGVVQYWYVTLFAIASCLVLVVLTRRWETRVVLQKTWYYAIHTVVFLVCVYLIVIGIRGGFGKYTRPITLSNALQYTNHPNETNIVLNTPFSIMRSTESNTFPRLNYFESDELDSIMSPIHIRPDNIKMRYDNVVVIILESFSKEYMGYFNSDLDSGTYKGYTPFLDSLASVGITYDLSLASGRKSIDAMPSVLSSIPMIISPYIVTPYSTNDVSSIAACLKQEGYSTAFFHGAPNGSMGFQAYARSAGFERYFGKSEYEQTIGTNDFDGVWAIWDEEFLQYYGREMTKMQEPFMTAVFTASSHHPFQIPARYEGVFDKGTLPIHQCIGYSDNALRKFFDYARTQSWFERTLFVITADHTNQLQHVEYTNDKGIYEVPIIFYSASMPAEYKGLIHREPVSQTDIMPSVLSYLNYPNTYFAYGQDALTQNKDVRYAINYNSGVYQIFSDSLLVQYDGEEVKGVWNFKHDRLLKKNLADEQQDSKVITDMVKYLQAYIQQYTNRLIDNRMTANASDE